MPFKMPYKPSQSVFVACKGKDSCFGIKTILGGDTGSKNYFSFDTKGFLLGILPIMFEIRVSSLA